MKLMRIAAVLAALILLTSCVSQSGQDINDFTESLNTLGSFILGTDAYRITAEDERHRYAQMPDDDTLICIYTGSDGYVVQCTLTALKDDKSFRQRCADIAEVFIGSNANKLTEKAFSDGSAEGSDCKLTLIDSDIGKTFLINRYDDELNTNGSPTLKKHINPEDVTRPTLGENNTSHN